MTQVELRSALKREPFTPLRVVLNNGEMFDIRHPELAWVGVSTLYLARPLPDDDELPGEVDTMLSIRNISKVEPAPKRSANGAKRQKNQ